MFRRPVVLCAAVLLAASVSLSVVAMSAAAASGNSRPARVGAAPTVPAGAQRVGTLAANHPLRVTVTLRPRDATALGVLAEAISTPGTAQYRRYLTEDGFVQRFAPSRATVAAVVASLRAEGLRAGDVSVDRLSVSVTATAGQLSRAFSTTLATVRLPSGRMAYANRSAPQFNAEVAPDIEGVIGLDNLAVAQPLGVVPLPHLIHPHLTPQVVTGGPQPCSAAVSAGPSNDAYTADQLASAYQFSSLYDASDFGAGQTIALFELETNLTSDISAYQACYGTSATVSYIEVDGGSSGAGEEAPLDIEDLIGLAPMANIDVYQGPNTSAGVYDTYDAIVTQHKTSVISTSWGECEALEGSTAATSENMVFEEAATLGESVVAAAGDNGSEDCQPENHSKALAIDDPASQPFVTGVGGTTLTTLGPPPTQTVWNEKPVKGGAGGGGISQLWVMPSYQSGAPSSLNVVNPDSSGTPCGASSGDCREVPDVSADADPYTGYVIYFDGKWTGIGGTSAATPLFGAFLALTNASTTCGGTPIGFANPNLYKAAATAYANDFSDITSGNNDYTGTNAEKFSATTGYDMASGLGTPIGSTLSTALCSGGSTAPQILSTSSTAATVGNPFSFTVTTSGSPTPSITETGALPSGVTMVDNGNGTATLAGTSADGTTGSYVVTVTANNGTLPNATQSFTLTVDPAPLTITASSTTMTYGGTVPTITPSYSGFVNDDNASSLTKTPACSTSATSASAVGTYPSSCTGAADANYTIGYVNGSVTVDPAPLTITASSTTMTYGGTVPTITPSYSGFVNDDNASSLTKTPACSTSATSASAVGTYPSSCTGAVDANYTIGYVNGSVTVESTFRVTTTSVSSATPGVAYKERLQAVGGVTPYKWKVIGGSLPKGLKLTPSGLLHGTPTIEDTARTYAFTVQVRDSTKHERHTATSTFSLILS